MLAKTRVALLALARGLPRMVQPCMLCAALWAAGAAAYAASPSDAAPAVQPLVPGVAWLQGRFVAGAQPDGNSVLFETRQGVVVFDAGRHLGHAQTLLAYLTARKQPLTVLVNSHWHLDHIGGNAALRAAHPAAQLWASRAIDDARSGFLARYRASLQQELVKLPADAPERATTQQEVARIDARAAQTATHPVDAAGARASGGHEFLLGLEGPAVTAGDVWLYDPERRVLAAGDLVTLPAPLFDTACPAHWADALDRLAAVPFDWLVPGHGAPMQRAGLETYRTAYRNLLRCAASDAPVAQCTDGWLHDASMLIGTDAALARGLVGYYFDAGPLRKADVAACKP